MSDDGKFILYLRKEKESSYGRTNNIKISQSGVEQRCH